MDARRENHDTPCGNLRLAGRKVGDGQQVALVPATCGAQALAPHHLARPARLRADLIQVATQHRVSKRVTLRHVAHVIFLREANRHGQRVVRLHVGSVGSVAPAAPLAPSLAGFAGFPAGSALGRRHICVLVGEVADVVAAPAPAELPARALRLRVEERAHAKREERVWLHHVDDAQSVRHACLRVCHPEVEPLSVATRVDVAREHERVRCGAGLHRPPQVGRLERGVEAKGGVERSRVRRRAVCWVRIEDLARESGRTRSACRAGRRARPSSGGSAAGPGRHG
mmetsp:Transcript_2006/g.6672  ORF Transcript_2006/g.6672 Transcript_2006/m.6672 type:complete len:284 (+) Transcript_2006:692-1543(+)